MRRKVLPCLGLSLLLFSGPLAAERKNLTVREQVSRFLGGTVVQVEMNDYFPETSLTQRLTLIVDRNGVKSKAYMDITVDKDLNILSRKITSGSGGILWMAAPAAIAHETPKPGYDYEQCKQECADACSRKRTARQRVACYTFCVGACDLIYKYPTPTVSR